MKAVEVRRQRFVAVPADVLWQIVEPAETLPAWLPICERCDVVSGDGRGRRQRLHARWGAKRAEIEAEVIEYVPPSRLAWRHVSEQIDGKPAPKLASDVTTTVELHAEGAGTRVVLTSRSVPSSPVSALVLRLIALRRIGRTFDRALARLAGVT